MSDLTVEDVIAQLAATDHKIFLKNTKLLVTNASLLTQEERDLIAAHREELLIVVPTFPEPSIPQSIIQFLGEAPQETIPADWALEPPPSLDGITDLEVDFETDGLEWWKADRPIGFSLRLPGGFKKYYPFAHRGFENLDENRMRKYMQAEFKNKRITNANTRFDIHMAREWGVDWVDQGCTFSDVMHYAALLNDHRKQFSLNVLAKDYLGHEKIGMELDPTRMAYYPPWIVAQRAEGDVQTVHELTQIMYPLMEAEGLHRVRALEDAIIPVVCEMEKNGCPLDVELLATENAATLTHYQRLIKEISHEVGFNFDASNASFIRLFEKYHIPLVFLKKKDSDEYSDLPSFKDAILERIDHPVVKKARFADQLASLRSKIHKPYTENVGADGILRVQFNQLRIENEHGRKGTVSGRFSAPYVQQVPNAGNHRAVFGDLYNPRKLYVPGNGLFFAADAAQIEYRIFASHAKNPRVMAAYAENPALSFHKLIWPLITRYRPDFTYEGMKSFNFMRIYGGGLVKTAVMIKEITEEEGIEIDKAKNAKTSPKLARAREIEAIYTRELPEVGPLLQKAKHLAMSECGPYCRPYDENHKRYRHRGYVKTLMGRRARFPNDYKIHKALNSIIQGSAADIMKTKLVELHQRRKEFNLTMRATIHDETTGDVPDLESARLIGEQLNVQSLDMAVPILWETGTGKNWAEAK